MGFREDQPERDGSWLVFPVKGVVAGRYLVRVRVGVTDSPLVHEGGQFSKPVVDIQ